MNATTFAQVRQTAVTIACIICLLFAVSSAWARTIQIPAWYEFSAALEEVPQIDQPVHFIASLTALVDDIDNVSVSLVLPPGWSADKTSDTLAKLPAKQTHGFRFLIKPAGPLPNGGIGCSFQARVPKAALIESVRATGHDLGEAMAQAIANSPDVGNGYTDVAFALFAEEGFFPLGETMWLAYDDRFKPSEALRGPSVWKDELISTHQAETDVEMFDRLKQQLTSNPRLAEQLARNGIDVNRKRGDALHAQLVLATEAYLKGEFPRCLEWLTRFEGEMAAGEAGQQLELRIAGRNLRSLCLWASGNKRDAEELLRETFYLNRKLPVQRYVLRNLGLLTLEKGDRNTAREMFRLALEIKPAYSLLKKEFALLQKK
ncbi:MAG TPA: hypothetical protein PKO06_11835 [Candidatus Ozemobacteraceae bacterium]|nr:hypothetical protein [Candidatus Ozemobacteraceae bacterium]